MPRHMLHDEQRILRWDGCRNVRDLGGLRHAQRGATAFRVAIRADSIRQLSREGWGALRDCGVALAVDLRGEYECVDDPPDGVPIEIMRLPMDTRPVPEVEEWRSMRHAYRALLAHFAPQFAAAVTAVGEAKAPVVIHCAGGRDRTGLASALLLRLAGVGLEEIAADHALSDEIYAPVQDDWLSGAADEVEREWRRRVATPAGMTMAIVLEELEARYGSVAAYLACGGAPRAALTRACERLVAAATPAWPLHP